MPRESVLDSVAATVFVIDDEVEVRQALTRLLRSAGLSVVAHGSAHEFLAQAPYRSAGCILLDVDMPGMSGPELHDRLSGSGISMPVIYLTGQGSVSLGVNAMKKGASDFFEKPVDADRLLPAIDQALQVHRKLQVEQQRMGDIEQRLAKLSKREREVMGFVIAGRLNKQIAGEMGIAEKTVKVHRSRMMEKMGCRSVAALVHLCDEHDFARGPGKPGA